MTWRVLLDPSLGIVGLGLIFGLLMGLPFVAHAGMPISTFQDAVSLYRQGHFMQASEVFNVLRQEHPEDSRAMYYWAMSQAQLGRYEQAKQGYETVIALDPNGKAAPLAERGLAALPDLEAQQLDGPPLFDQSKAPISPKALITASAPRAPGSLGNPKAMDPQKLQQMQQLMMMQSMMGGGNQANNNNAWMMPLMMQQQGNDGQASSLDPSVIQSMMTNQMMQGFDFGAYPDKR